MFNTRHVASRLYFLVAFMSILMIVMGVMGLKTTSDTVESLHTVYQDRAVPLVALGKINLLLSGNFTEVLRAIQHDPNSHLAKLHDHPLSEHLVRIEANKKTIDERWQQYMATSHTTEEKLLVEDFSKKRDEYVNNVLLPTITALKNNDYSTEMIDAFLKGNRKLGTPMNEAMAALISLQERISSEEYNNGMARYSSARNMTIGLIVVGLILGLLLAYWIIGSITVPLNRVRSTIADVERNSDFTRYVDVSSEDEVGQTAKSFNQLISTMQGTVRSVLDNVGRVSDGVASLASSSNQVAASSAQQSEAASAMAASVEQMTVSISHVSDSARDALTISRKSGELSAQGGHVIHRAVDEMNQIAGTVREASSAIDSLGQQSERITSVVQVIKEVADQTNLLALNAAIEAARAGEQGRGFAVVADEVRKLAERTTKATEEIAAMVNAMQDSARSAVNTMENAVNRVGSGASLAQQAGDAINQIKSGADQVIQVVNDITSALAEQTMASNDIAAHVEQVAQMTEENSAAAGAAASAAAHVEQLTGEMRSAVSRFKI